MARGDGALAVRRDSTLVAAGTETQRRQRQRRLPAVKDTYAPGALRAVTDAERGRMAVFCERHPELARLGYEGLRQVAATYRDDEDRAVRGEMEAGGVPLSWRREESDDVNPAWSDEQ